jgi:hypothetical protein
MRFRSGGGEPSARFHVPHVSTSTRAAAVPLPFSAPHVEPQVEEAAPDAEAGTWFDSSIELRAGLDVFELPAGARDATFRTGS